MVKVKYIISFMYLEVNTRVSLHDLEQSPDVLRPGEELEVGFLKDEASVGSPAHLGVVGGGAVDGGLWVDGEDAASVDGSQLFGDKAGLRVEVVVDNLKNKKLENILVRLFIYKLMR